MLLRYNRSKSTVRYSNCSANQPFIMVFDIDTDFDNERLPYISFTTDDGVLILSYIINNSYTFDFTEYVRNKFVYQESPSQLGVITPAAGNPVLPLYTDTTLSVKVTLPAMSAYTEELVSADYYVNNSVIDSIEDDINVGVIQKRFLTNMNYDGANSDYNYIIKYPNYTKYLYFNNNTSINNSLTALYNNGKVYQYSMSAYTGRVAGIAINNDVKTYYFGSPAVYNYAASDSAHYPFYTKAADLTAGQTYYVNIPEYVVNTDTEWAKGYCLVTASDFQIDLPSTWEVIWKATDPVRVNASGQSLYIIFADYNRVLEMKGSEETKELDSEFFNFISEYYVNDTKIGNIVNKYNVVLKQPGNHHYWVRWINQYGGWDYYMFDCHRTVTNTLNGVDSLNIKKPIFDSSIAGWHLIDKIEYAREKTTTIGLKSNTEYLDTYKALCFLPFSTVVQHWNEGNSGWENISVEDFENSYRICEQNGTVAFNIIQTNQYGLSYVK